MAEVTLSDYTGYIFLEIIKAREMADAYSRSMADRYAKDPILRYFSVPRFRTPKMDLTIPILISGARFKQTIRFSFPEADFVTFVISRASDVRATVELAQSGGLHQCSVESRSGQPSAALTALAHEFHAQLATNPDPQHPDTIVTVMWTRMFRTCLDEAHLLKFYEGYDPKHNLLTTTTNDVLSAVHQRTFVDQTAIESLLINPETNVVKNGSSETSVFTVNAELLEEGIFFRDVVDEETHQTHTIVEFE